ncbi:MAG: pyridoxamine 5'-phosphate oxidase [Gammaproteobacteria bacterium]|nr:MAG: pyridoxamine 5'-phosphate oxidase [Gammaproteobacteria bacterium]
MSSTALKRHATALLSGARYGVLGTRSAEEEGFPYGSVAPFCLDEAGCPVILISELAQHSRNIAADPRVSLTVLEDWAAEKVQEVSRLCLLGRADREVTQGGRGRYLERFPEAGEFLQLDFVFHRIVPHRVHFIEGFGRVRWLEPEDLRS